MAERDGRYGIGADAISGALAGVLGTVAMTTLMEPGLAGYLSPKWRPTEFVPKQIIEWAERTVGRAHLLPEEQERLAAVLAHFGYGSTMGVLYGLLRGRRRETPAALWGVLVWGAGYEGWLPAAGVRPATTDFPPTRWPLPIANHVLFGVATALAFERLRR